MAVDGVASTMAEADMAEAGGKDASALDSALDAAYSVVEEILA